MPPAAKEGPRVQLTDPSTKPFALNEKGGCHYTTYTHTPAPGCPSPLTSPGMALHGLPASPRIALGHVGAGPRKGGCACGIPQEKATSLIEVKGCRGDRGEQPCEPPTWKGLGSVGSVADNHACPCANTRPSYGRDKHCHPKYDRGTFKADWRSPGCPLKIKMQSCSLKGSLLFFESPP